MTGSILLCRVIVSVFRVVPHQFPHLSALALLKVSTSTQWVDIHVT